MTVSLINRLAAAAAASAQSFVQFRLKLVGQQITANLNKQIAQLQAQSQDPQLPQLQHQEATLTSQKQGYDNALTQIGDNGNALGDLSLQLGNLANAAAQGDATTFDQALSAANTDVGVLQVIPSLPGLVQDGVVGLQAGGLGIQPSATYNLSTAAGQAQAAADVQAAQTLVQQISASNTINQGIGSAISQSLDGQITAISDHISNEQATVLGDAATKIAKLKQQAQTQFHLIELQFGKVGQTAGILTSIQNANNTAPPPGTVVSLLVGQSGGPSLAVANLTPVAPPQVGGNVSTSA